MDEREIISVCNLPQKVDYTQECRTQIKIHLTIGKPTLTWIRDHYIGHGLVDPVTFDRMLTELRPPQGLGDYIAKVTQVTGIDWLANKVAKLLGKKGCGCGARREKLNAILPMTFNVKEQ